MSLSQKDAANHYIVNTDTKGCTPFTFLHRQKASTKSIDAERIMELEKKQVDLESILAEKTISYNNELVELKNKQVRLESIIEKNRELYYNQQMSDNTRFREEETQLKNQLREKQEEINDLAVHLTVLTEDVDKYVSKKHGHDQKRLENTIVFMKQRMSKINVSRDYNLFNAIENIWDALRASREQQRKEEAQSGAMLHD